MDDASDARFKKSGQRLVVDYTSSVVRYLQGRTYVNTHSIKFQPSLSQNFDTFPPIAYQNNPSTSYCTKFMHYSVNKVRCSINRVMWEPSGRRVITGSQNGEFTLWNGQIFNFEMILQAHEVAIRSMTWSHNEKYIVTGDHAGCIKYWQPNMNNVKEKQDAHKEAVRDISFASTDLKFVSCSDDHSIKVWDFFSCQQECQFTGHGGDVKSVDWHPSSSLLASGAKDNLVKLWDARTSRELFTLHGHKNGIMSVRWNQNGNWILSASRDQVIKLYDVRKLEELQSFKGHSKEVTALAWHPIHEDMFASGGFDGSILFWLVGLGDSQAEVLNAHESSVWDLAWHPLGHMLCSGSNDQSTRFWSRNLPGDSLSESNREPEVEPREAWAEARVEDGGQPSVIPGLDPVAGSGIPGVDQ